MFIIVLNLRKNTNQWHQRIDGQIHGAGLNEPLQLHHNQAPKNKKSNVYSLNKSM